MSTRNNTQSKTEAPVKVTAKKSTGGAYDDQQIFTCQMQLNTISTSSTKMTNGTEKEERLLAATSGLSNMLDLARDITGSRQVQYLSSDAPDKDMQRNSSHRKPNSGKREDCKTDDYYAQVIVDNKCIGYLKFSGIDNSEHPTSFICDALGRQFGFTMDLYLKIFKLSKSANNLYRSRQLLLAADDARRQDIAEIIHGNMQVRMLTAWQRLFDAQNHLTSDPEDARKCIQWVSDELDKLRERDLRELARKLHPNITAFGMLASIRSLIRQVSNMNNDLHISLFADKKLEIIDYPGKSQIDNKIRLSAYRFVEEAIVNAIRHGQATAVRIEAHMVDDNSIQVSVIDNGVSFDPERTASGVGFASIDARIGQVGGRWKIESSRENGTTITATIPLDLDTPSEHVSYRDNDQTNSDASQN